MSLELCILASGSGGNTTILRTPVGAMLIDAGIGPRTAAKRMNGTGVSVADLRAICLTHLDSDHFRPSWWASVAKQQMTVYCHLHKRSSLHRSIEFGAGSVDPETVPIRTFNEETFEPLEGVRFRPVALAHDDMGSHGFLIEGFGRRVGYATDLGRVPRHLLEHFCDIDVLAIESNYDVELEMSSARPMYLKRRIMGGRGHLSNEQAFEAVRAILDRCTRMPQHIVLLHRSRECNCPKILRKLFESDRRISPRLTLAEQFERTEWLGLSDRSPLAGEQLVLPHLA